MRSTHHVLCAALALALGLALGCGKSSPLAPSATGRSGTHLDVPADSGEWTLVVPDGVPQNGCITATDLKGLSLPTVDGVPALQWQVKAADNHPNPIFIAAQFFHEERDSCELTDGEIPRDLDISGHSNFVAGETGTTTLTWLTDRCRDGGRFEFDIMVEQVLKDEGSSARQFAQLVVNCEFPSPVPDESLPPAPTGSRTSIRR